MPEILTPHLSLPLPHPDNSLAEDVIRIRDAFTVLDQKIAALDTLLTSDDLTLDSVQELVGAIKAARTDIGSLNALVARQLAAQNTAINAQLAAQNTAINAQLAAQNEAVAQQLAALSALVYAGL